MIPSEGESTWEIANIMGIGSHLQKNEFIEFVNKIEAEDKMN